MTDHTAAVVATPTAQRVFEGSRIWLLSTDLIGQAVRLIAAAEDPHAPDLIIGIARGGVPVARHLSETMNVPYTIVTARHNIDDHVGVQATGTVTVDAGRPLPDITGRRILLVDDICGTGATLDAVRAALAAYGPAGTIRTAALCRNTGSPAYPDTWVWEVSDWTVFPWESTPDQPTESLPAPNEVRHP